MPHALGTCAQISVCLPRTFSRRDYWTHTSRLPHIGGSHSQDPPFPQVMTATAIAIRIKPYSSPLDPNFTWDIPKHNFPFLVDWPWFTHIKATPIFKKHWCPIFIGKRFKFYINFHSYIFLKFDCSNPFAPILNTPRRVGVSNGV